MLLGNKTFVGLLLVRVLCPRNMLYPFLLLRDETTGKVSTPVCRTCSEKAQIEACKHTIR